MYGIDKLPRGMIVRILGAIGTWLQAVAFASQIGGHLRIFPLPAQKTDVEREARPVPPYSGVKHPR